MDASCTVPARGIWQEITIQPIQHYQVFPESVILIIDVSLLGVCTAYNDLGSARYGSVYVTERQCTYLL
jgi:hypothetical protein